MQSSESKDYLPEELQEVLTEIENGRFGHHHDLKEIAQSIKNRNDIYLIGADFKSYLEA